MELQITAHNFQASDALRKYATGRLAKLERFYDGIVHAHVVLGVEGDPNADKTAEIVLSVYQRRLAASDQAATHEAAIDTCVERLRRQVIKYKEKLRSTDKDAHR